MKVDEQIFEKILRTDQKELKKYCEEELLRHGYKDIVDDEGFLYARGDLPILLIAHLDRHFNLKEKVITIDKTNIDKHGRIKWMSPEGIAGDDRCGVYILLSFLDAYRPYVLFCEDEEIGCVGAKKFVNSSYINEIKNLNYLMQFDRGQTHNNPQGKHNKNGRDVIFYDMTNDDFINKVCEYTGYKIGQGVGTDVTHIMNTTNLAGFTISCGYYGEHHLNEYIVLEEMEKCFDACKNVIDNMHDRYYKMVNY